MDQPTNDQLLAQLGVGGSTFAAKLAEISGAVMRSDQASQIAHLEYLKAVAQLPNLVVDQTEELGFGLDPVSRHDERPAFTGVDMTRVGFTKVKQRYNMRIGSRTTAAAETDVKVGSETEVSASGGFLFSKASVKSTLTAEVRHNSKNTRDTDMSAELEIEADIDRLPSPEGLQMMSDSANEFSSKMNELRMKIAGAKVDRLIDQIDNGTADVDAMTAKGAIPEGDSGKGGTKKGK